MWFIFDSIEHRDDLISRKGTTYSAYILKGQRKGFPAGEPNTPYEKIIFNTTSATVVEHDIPRYNCSVAQFFQKAVKPGDLIAIKFERGTGKNQWEISELKHLKGDLPTYEPLTNEQVTKLKTEQHAAQQAQDDVLPPWVK